MKKSVGIKKYIYRCFQKCHILVPKWLARLLSFSDKPVFNAIDIATYDGSNQVCHPSVCKYNNSFFLACTPYPYGCEEYENPCIYEMTWEGSSSHLALAFGPIVKPQKLRYEYYSDPCIFQCGDELFCAFRKVERRRGVILMLFSYQKASMGILGHLQGCFFKLEEICLFPRHFVKNICLL
jgi:hypothetical protein